MNRSKIAVDQLYEVRPWHQMRLPTHCSPISHSLIPALPTYSKRNTLSGISPLVYLVVFSTKNVSGIGGLKKAELPELL